MSSVPTSFYNNILPTTSRDIEAQHLPFDLQNCIKQGDVQLLKKNDLDEIFLTQSLPNGEMPLHFAVRTGKQEIVHELLVQGANPELTDFQNLSAIDHAVLMKNENILATILGFKIGEDLNDILEQIKYKGSAKHVNQLKARIKKTFTVNVNHLPQASRAAYNGELDILRTIDVNEIDPHGLRPIHYAILSEDLRAVDELVKLEADLKVLTREGDSLLHFAAMTDSEAILQKLINLKAADPNHQNSSGSTALHYAAANDNISFVQLLINDGRANPRLLDNEGMSPLALIGASAYQRDPLSLPKKQIVLFAALSLYWLTHAALDRDWVTSDYTKAPVTLVLLGSLAVSVCSEFAVLVTSLDRKWKKILAWISIFGFAYIPPINIGYQAWSTYHVARASFQGLKKCWTNVGYRNWAIARNVVVYGVNTANSIDTLYRQCTYVAYLCSYLLK